MQQAWKSRADVPLNNYRTLVLCPLWYTVPDGQSINTLMGLNCRFYPLSQGLCQMPNALSIGSLFSLRLLLLDTLLMSCLFFSILRSFSSPFLFPPFFFLLYFSSTSNCKFGIFFVNISPPESDVFRMHTLKSFSIHSAFWEQFANAAPSLKLTDFQVKRVVRWDDEYSLFVVGGEKFQTRYSVGRLKTLVSKMVRLCGVGNPYKAKYQSVAIIFFRNMFNNTHILNGKTSYIFLLHYKRYFWTFSFS